MKYLLIFFLFFLSLPALRASGSCPAKTAGNPHVLMKTDYGNIEFEIYLDKAPVTAGNFLNYVRQGLYDGACFYRVVTMDNQPRNNIKIEVIQGGLDNCSSKQPLPPIEHEPTNKTGVYHLDGTLSMARNQPGTASSEFFICIGDQPELDYGGRRHEDGQGFAAFGQVVKGMDVVRKIQSLPNTGQMLDQEVRINQVTIIN